MLKNVRIIFSKTGRAKYISHLDLTRTMTRVVRRAGIPLWYTQGYNKHPYLTFAAPLSLGYEGLRETMDIRLEEDMSGEEIVSRLNEAMPEGIIALEAGEAVAKPGDLAAAVYRITLDCPADTVRQVLAADTLTVEKRTKKKTLKTIDIRPYFAEACIEAGDNGGCVMTVTLPSGGAENINPGLFVTALNSVTGKEWTASVLRLQLLLADGTEFR